MDARAQMEIEWQCIALNRAFAFLEDAIREPETPDRIAALFTSDGVIETNRQSAQGHAAIKAWTSWSKDLVPNYVSRHIIPNFHFTRVDQNSAEAVVYNITYQGHEEPGRPMDIVYIKPQGFLLRLQMKYRNTPEGWRITLLKVDSSFNPIDDVQHAGVWADGKDRQTSELRPVEVDG